MINTQATTKENNMSLTEKFATVEIMRTVSSSKIEYRTIWVSEEEWKRINYVDYIQFDVEGNLLPEYDVHSEQARAAMRMLANERAR
jgi:hypothetical protein